MKTLVCCMMTALCAIALAEDAKKPAKPELTPQERAARRAEREMRRYGGIVRKANSAQGKVVFLNAQKTVPSAQIVPVLKHIEQVIHPELALVDVDSVKVGNPAADIRKAGGTIGVVIVEAADVPALLAAPESRWAQVNVAALKDGASPEKLVRRVQLEVLRAFALAGGCAFLASDPIAMRPNVLIPEDLDNIEHVVYGMDIRERLARNLPALGVTPWRQTTYKQACKEGWAPQPTNDYQKAIWDDIHAIPTNPLPLVKPTK